jgi:hypothetical protein
VTLRGGCCNTIPVCVRSLKPSGPIAPFVGFMDASADDDSLLRARRQHLHQRIARMLEERFPAVAEAETEILAHHFSRAELVGPACLCCERAAIATSPARPMPKRSRISALRSQK